MSEGSLPRSALDEKDGEGFKGSAQNIFVHFVLFPQQVFLADTGKELFVWIGNGSSPDEKKNAITYAHV